ncbi:hypothetical protein NQ317_008856 [Molorchus minor]|uniref:Trs120/TRAPPC9 TPR region domain-containing protein n=1 Tax=Molorchus minor TaxID=1323400 RepID=A0ABQ9JZG8_9CUCU|nr:hypothetical protein NQ317_008856 [Molorchus minor]
MSHPDYEQYSHDHAALLILVKHIGSQLKPKTYLKFFDRISKINNVKITDSTGQKREILVRYVKEYPVENNDWGDFQTHRRLLGLISLGKFDSQQELNELCRVHESFKVKYNATLFDSRSILLSLTKATEGLEDTDSNSSGDSESRSEITMEKFTTPTECLTYYAQAAEILKSVNDWLWLGGAYEGLSAASALILYPDMQRNIPLQRNASLQEGSPRKSSLSTCTIPSVNKKLVANALLPEDISKRYREAIIHYSKYQNAGIVETEASFKAARIAVEQNHALQAASFYRMLSILIWLFQNRKKFKGTSLPKNSAPNWARCYALMLQSLPGHQLTLDPVEMRAANQGWPALQIQLLQELVVAAKRTGHSALATRHMTFLLQTMWPHLSPTEQKELAVQLQNLSAQCEGSPVPLVLDSGLVVPPANLTDIPICASFTLKDLQPHLRPRRLESLKQDMGPFLFTPIHFGGGSLERKYNKAHSKMDFLWVENEKFPILSSARCSKPYFTRDGAEVHIN